MPTSLADLPTWVLSSAATRAHQILQSALADAGFSGYEYRCLWALTTADRLSQTDLGVAAALDPGDVTHTVRALEERGLVRREPDPGHGRRRLVSLTRAGREAADALDPVMADVQDAVLRGLTEKERTTLVRLLARVGRP